MDLINRFERFIERLMERTFTRAARSHLQPVEIGKRLVRAMESEQTVGVQGVIVPNVYDVYLSPDDYAHFEPMRRSLTQNMAAHVGRVARQRRFHLVSPPLVRLHSSEDVSTGDVMIEPRLEDVEPAVERVSQHTAVLPAVDPYMEVVPSPAARAAHPVVRLNGATYAVLRSPTLIGRAPDNDIVFEDKRVSRHHAEVLQRGNNWTVRDMGSTNGTAVNGKVISESQLRPGDTISLGGLEVTWEQ